MIEIDGLTKRYGDKTAVDGLSFVVEPGVVTGFLGPNGAGKSTTMRVIAGLDRPTSGTVRVNGKQYPEASRVGLVRRQAPARPHCQPLARSAAARICSCVLPCAEASACSVGVTEDFPVRLDRRVPGRSRVLIRSGCFGAGFGEGEPLVAEVGDDLQAAADDQFSHTWLDRETRKGPDGA